MRTIDEWKGATDDAVIPVKVKLRIIEKAKGCCQDCLRQLMLGEQHHYDHKVPLADGGNHGESNLQILCTACHGSKTGGEAKSRASARRTSAAARGLKPAPAKPIQSAPFQKTEKASKREEKSSLPPRPLFWKPGTLKAARRFETEDDE